MAEDRYEVALKYAEDRLGRPPNPRKRRRLSPPEVMELLFDFHPLFTPRFDAIRATPYNDAFADEADMALVKMARSDDFAAWDALPTGAWRVLSERLLYLETVVALNMAAGTKVFTSSPRGLDRKSCGRFVLLLLLLGEARTIPPEMIDRSDLGALSGHPMTSLRRQ